MKISIQNVGRISSGEIEPSDLTLFIGQNDSGKTYAATTLWAFLKHIDKASRNSVDEAVTGLNDFLDKLCTGRETNYKLEIPYSEWDALRTSISNNFNHNISEILRDAIGFDGFEKSSISVAHKFRSQLKLTAEVSRYEELQEDFIDSDDPDEPPEETFRQVEVADLSVHITLGDVTTEVFSVNGIEAAILRDITSFQLKRTIVGVACCGVDWLAMRNVIYLPAARTGIMLALDYFVSGILDRSKMGRDELEETGSLPAPIQDFARTLSRPTFFLSRTRPKHSAALSNLIQGKFTRRDRHRGEYLYSMNEGKGEIPLASTSSLVTELAALSVLSHRVGHRTLLIFEEPEAHLHLAAQREMARALAKIVHSGVRVLITTHSDTFLQQLNNLMALHHLQSNTDLLSEIGVTEDDLIDSSRVSAFDFVCENGTTSINEIPVSEKGIVAESLNKVLLDLAEETLKISDALQEK
ncbi:AAA family ATPase [Tritonibacter mobilis]|uniref:AAA family ATPase n=1 Tax=Tritonibacter mobilis TaxID=379347 RepID=UPI000806AFC0|nr:AAA family ATPase [Tritonibacter mobilis]